MKGKKTKITRSRQILIHLQTWSGREFSEFTIVPMELHTSMPMLEALVHTLAMEDEQDNLSGPVSPLDSGSSDESLDDEPVKLGDQSRGRGHGFSAQSSGRGPGEPGRKSRKRKRTQNDRQAKKLCQKRAKERKGPAGSVLQFK